MQLRIEGSELTREFGSWMLQIIKAELNAHVDKKRLSACYDLMISEFNTNVSVEVFWKQSLDSLTYDLVDDTLIFIHFDSNAYLVNNIKLETLCKLVNFGTLERKGYPVYTDTFTRIASNINNYIKLYELTGG